MASSEKTIVNRFVGGCFLVLAGVVMLWVAVWVIQQIWLWLLLGLGLIGLAVGVVLLVRWRRDRWFR